MRKRIITTLLALASLPALWAAEQELYSDTKALSNWDGITIEASKLSEVGKGDVIRIYTSSVSNAVAGFQTPNGVSLYPNETSFNVFGDFSLIVSNAVVSTLQSNGLRIAGNGFTIERVTIDQDPKEKLLFEGTLDIAYYTPTLTIPAFQFHTIQLGDVIKVSVSNVKTESRGCLQNASWENIKQEYGGFELKGNYEMTVDEKVLSQLQEGVLRVRGAYHTVTRVSLYCPSSGYVIDPADKREAPMMFGLNESGGEFAGVYPGIDGTHYGYPNKSDLQYAKKKGFGIVRLPFRWERVLRPLGSTTLISSEIQKIKQVLDWAAELNLRVIFDMHNFGRYCTYCNGSNSNANVYKIIGEDNTCTVEHFKQVWRLLAQEFKNYECIWAYEIMNEPYAMLSSTPWFQIAQEGIYAIREYDTHTPILIDGDSFATARNWVAVSDNLRTLNDPADNLIYTAHCYFDHDSSGEYSKSYDNSGANEQTGVNRLKPFVEWCQQYGLRGFVGEYGIPDDDTRWLTVLENALAYLKENGIGGTYWSAGHRWGDYKLAVHPTNNYQTDRPQMASLVKYLFYPDGQPTGNPQLPIANSQDDGLWYTLQGVPVTHPGRGIYIHNGRKVVR